MTKQTIKQTIVNVMILLTLWLYHGCIRYPGKHDGMKMSKQNITYNKEYTLQYQQTNKHDPMNSTDSYDIIIFFHYI